MNQNACYSNKNEDLRLKSTKAKPPNDSHLFSRFRKLSLNTLAKNLLGSGLEVARDGDDTNHTHLDINRIVKIDEAMHYKRLDSADYGLTPTENSIQVTSYDDVYQSISTTNGIGRNNDGFDLTSPLNAGSSVLNGAHISPCLPGVKKMFVNLTRSPSIDNHQQVPSGHARNYNYTRKASNSISSISSAVASVYGSDLETPPLTPDSFNNHDFVSPAQEKGHTTGNANDSCSILQKYFSNEEEDPETDQSRSFEIKEGKKPALPDVQANDHTQDSNTLDDLQESVTEQVIDDQDEWFGLEYTLEMSSRERHPSNPQPCSNGEHSRSRESWAALHQGRIHPFFADEEYHHWKNWRHLLDRQEERKKHRKGFAFKELSNNLAWFYADEIRTRDILYWQKEVYGMISTEVKERLSYIAEYRSDPYYPPKIHNLGWYLKRSRSVSCLRELQPTLILEPSLFDMQPDEDGNLNSAIDSYHDGYHTENGPSDGIDLGFYFSDS